jgi:hypothetical protein
MPSELSYRECYPQVCIHSIPKDHLLAGKCWLQYGMDKYDVRRTALRLLVDGLGRGGIARVAQAIGKAPDYVSRMLYEPGKPGGKRIGEDSVERITEAFPGWLNAAPSTAPDAEDELVSMVSQAVLEREIPDHVRESIKLLISSSPKKPKG